MFRDYSLYTFSIEDFDESIDYLFCSSELKSDHLKLIFNHLIVYEQQVTLISYYAPLPPFDIFFY